MGDPWRDRLRPLERLSAYAATFRYSLRPVPKIEGRRSILATLLALHASASRELLAKKLGGDDACCGMIGA
jgi:hypothetical protein